MTLLKGTVPNVAVTLLRVRNTKQPFAFDGSQRKRGERGAETKKGGVIGSHFRRGVLMNLTLLSLASKANKQVHTQKHSTPRPWVILSHMALLNYFLS